MFSLPLVVVRLSARKRNFTAPRHVNKKPHETINPSHERWPGFHIFFSFFIHTFSKSLEGENLPELRKCGRTGDWAVVLYIKESPASDLNLISPLPFTKTFAFQKREPFLYLQIVYIQFSTLLRFHALGIISLEIFRRLNSMQHIAVLKFLFFCLIEMFFFWFLSLLCRVMEEVDKWQGNVLLSLVDELIIIASPWSVVSCDMQMDGSLGKKIKRKSREWRAIWPYRRYAFALEIPRWLSMRLEVFVLAVMATSVTRRAFGRGSLLHNLDHATGNTGAPRLNIP